MIENIEQLNEILLKEKQLHLGSNSFKNMINAAEGWFTYQFLSALRKCEYHRGQSGFIHKLMYLFYLRRKNVLGAKYGIYAWPGSIGGGVYISHLGSILINGNAVIGKNCIFHGENCVGSVGHGAVAPVLGDGVELGVGAKVIGDVYLADGVVVGANAVVTKSCFEKNAVLAGVPSVVIKHGIKEN